MEQSIEKYDPSKIMDAVRDRIRAEFVALIPEATWTEMIKREVDIFLKAGLAVIVRAELQAEVTRRMADIFKTPEWGNHWGPGAPVSEEVKKLLVSHLPDIIEVTFGNMLQQLVQRMKQGY